MGLVFACLVTLIVAAFGPGVAQAHPTGTTLLTVTRSGGTVSFDVLIPLDKLGVAVGKNMTDHPADAIAEQTPALRDMFTNGVQLGVSTGNADDRWPVTVETLELGNFEGADQLHAHLTALSKSGPIPDTFVLTYHVLVDVLANHDVYVAAKTKSDGSADLLGTISKRHPSLVMTLARPTAIDVRSMIGHGLNHFRTGTDYIVFLALIAGSTAFARSTVFAGSRKRRRVVDLAYRTTAFTIGHSISLALAAGGVLSPPSKPIETGIAITVLLSAVHLARPIAPKRSEPVMALLFGLIHGFGFVGTLGALGLRGSELFIATLGFNIGIEIAQLGADLIIAPPLWWLARSPAARYVVAFPAAVVAVGWIVERTVGVVNPLESLVAFVAGVPERLGLALLALAGIVAIVRRYGRRPSVLPSIRRQSDLA